MTAGQLFPALAFYLLAARACLAPALGRGRMPLFALVNLVGTWVLVYPAESLLVPRKMAYFGLYVGLVMFQYFLLVRYASRPGWKPWLAFLAPIAFLLAVKFVPPLLDPIWVLTGRKPFSIVTIFLGISYLAFRSSALVLDVRNGVVARPGFWEYLGFCFFTPTMSVGPINSYGLFQKGFAGPDRALVPLGRSVLRILVGAVKFVYLSHLCYQLSYDGLLLDGHPHRPIELVLAAVMYYLFLYCNFSGFCDLAIGMAGLIGFPVEENFNQSFSSRNIQDYWNRWHITLSKYMRDVVFVPLTKGLIRRFGTAHADAAIAISIFTVFVLIGLWHGTGWHFVVFGALHGLAVVVVHFYGVGLKKWLGKDGYKRYVRSAWIRAVAIVVTFAYVSVCLFFFANDFDMMQRIFSVITW